MKYLLDSVILIDHFNGIDSASQFLLQNHHISSLSVITRAETLVGFDDTEKPTALLLLNTFTSFPITIEIADLATKFRQQYRIKLPDALQASVAYYHNLILVTRNTKDFQQNQTYFDRDDFILTPYQI